MTHKVDSDHKMIGMGSGIYSELACLDLEHVYCEAMIWTRIEKEFDITQAANLVDNILAAFNYKANVQEFEICITRKSMSTTCNAFTDGRKILQEALSDLSALQQIRQEDEGITTEITRSIEQHLIKAIEYLGYSDVKIHPIQEEACIHLSTKQVEIITASNAGTDTIWVYTICPKCQIPNWIRIDLPQFMNNGVMDKPPMVNDIVQETVTCYRCRTKFFMDKYMGDNIKSGIETATTIVGFSYPRYQIVRVGAAMFLSDPTRPGQVVIGKRKGAHGSGQYCLPGGKPDYGEKVDESIIRETKEETGLNINPKTMKKMTWADEHFLEDDLHFTTLFYRGELVADDWGREARLMEPDKNEGWQWIDIREMKSACQPLMPSLNRMIDEIIEIISGGANGLP